MRTAQYDDGLKTYYERLRGPGKHYNVGVCATAARLLERAYNIFSERSVETTEQMDAEVAVA